ncbi:TPA: hypothetical protein BOS_18237 [Bos taurus]|nr:TPA: hypothetical protein BOS_18237 [Bos taurus]
MLLPICVCFRIYKCVFICAQPAWLQRQGHALSKPARPCPAAGTESGYPGSGGSTCGAMMLPLSTIEGQETKEVQTRPPEKGALPSENPDDLLNKEEGKMSAKFLPICPLPSVCFAYYLETDDSDSDSQSDPDTSKPGLRCSSPSKPGVDHEEIQATCTTPPTPLQSTCALPPPTPAPAPEHLHPPQRRVLDYCDARVQGSPAARRRGAAGPARPPRLSPGQPGAEPPPRLRGSAPSGRVRSAGGGRRAAGGRCGVAAGGGGAPRAVRCVPAAGRGRAPGRPRGARGSPRAPQSSDPSERQAGDSWSEGSSGRRRASRLEGSEEDWAVRVRAWLGLLPGQVQEEQAPGPEPPGGSAGIPRASPVRASRKSTGPPIPLVPRVEERPGSRCQSRGSTCGAMMLPLSTIGGQGREEVQTRPPQRRALPFERTTGQRREPARKNARVSAKQVPTCPMPGFCFAFYMDSKDSEFDSQPSPGSSRGGSKYTSPAKPRAKYKEIQAWECPLCCLSVLYIS